MKTIIVAFFLLLTTTLTHANAEAIAAGNLRILDQWVREAPKSAKVGAGYLTIVNTGAASDTLIGVKAEFPRVTIHGVKNEGGVMKMYHIENVEIPAGEKVVLKPGSIHIMFMGLDQTGLTSGRAIEAILQFKNAGEVKITFPIRPNK